MTDDDKLYRALRYGSMWRIGEGQPKECEETFTELDIETVAGLEEVAFDQAMKCLLLYMVASKVAPKTKPVLDATNDMFEVVANQREEIECMITFLGTVSLSMLSPMLEVTDDVRATAHEWLVKLMKSRESLDTLYDKFPADIPWQTMQKDMWGRPIELLHDLFPDAWWLRV